MTFALLFFAAGIPSAQLVGHYSETASLNCNFERVRSDRGLGRYSPKIVYVLSGGAATGFCHLGMIESLEKRGIRPDLVIGTSAGALFGALYSHFGNVEDVFGQIELVLASDERQP